VLNLTGRHFLDQSANLRTLALSSMPKVHSLTFKDVPTPSPVPNKPISCLLVGDGIQFRDYLLEHFPDLVNTCVGRAELSKR
jgi:hypothetical protein